MRFEKLGPGAPSPLEFPDQPVIPNTTLVFDDAELTKVKLAVQSRLRACHDCRFFTMSNYSGTRCSEPGQKTWDPVWGLLDSKPKEQRSGEVEGSCGPDGQWWQPRPKRNWVAKLTWAVITLAFGVATYAASVHNWSH